MCILYIFQSLLILLFVSAILSNDEESEEDTLPTYAIPSHYSLYLVLDPNASTYNGSVQIDFSATTLLEDVIKLHASPKTIKIHSALLNYNHSCTVTDQDNDTEIVTLKCPIRSFKVQNSLVIRFQGRISTEDLTGLYKVTYKEDREDHALLVTYFQPMNARQAFPCFDEPKWKTTFDIFIVHPEDYSALANTPVMKQFPINSNQIQTQFKTTPPMSAYLIAFMVSKFVSTTDGTVREYDYRVFTRPDLKNFTSVAVAYGPTLIELFSNWTGIAYKDLGNVQSYQIAIPYFKDGAMENWGLITFGEEDLLDEKEITSNSNKQSIISIIAHELAHHWFGDYVTLDWWSDLWLNEGFATYFEYYITDQLDDNLEMMKQFVVKELQRVLEVDSELYATALSSDVNNEEDSEIKFDDITYYKGASIIRMLRRIIGEDDFRTGIQLYLSTYKYNNTNPSLLLNSFKTVVPSCLEKVMHNWIYKPGFPLVTAKLNGSTVTLTQERFVPYNSTEFEDTQWYVPITYTTKSEKNFNGSVRGWLEPNSTLDIKVDSESWIILNLEQTGFYRVNYDDTLWQRIINALKNNRTDIDVLNRAQLISDVFNIARIGQISYQTAFNLAEYLRYETDYYPWFSAFNAFSYMFKNLGDEEIEKLLQLRILSWLNKAFPSNNTNMGSSHVDKLKEVLIMDWACKLGQEECTAYANETFHKFKTTYSLPDNNKRGIVFCYGFRNSPNPAEDYDFLFNLYKNSTSILQQFDILSSLGCTNDTDLLLKYLSETVSKNSPIGKQDAARVFDAVYTKSEIGLDATLSFLKRNIKNLSTRFHGMDTLPDLIMGLSEEITTISQLKMLSQFCAKLSKLENIEVVDTKISAHIIVLNLRWAYLYADKIKEFL